MVEKTKLDLIIEFNKSSQRKITLKELKEKSLEWKTKIITKHSLFGCGDILHLLIKLEKKKIIKCFFSSEECCLFTSTLTDILCVFFEGKNKKEVKKIINLFLKEKNGDFCYLGSKAEFFRDELENENNRKSCVLLAINIWKTI